MSMKEAVLAALNELLLPELQMLRLEQGEIRPPWCSPTSVSTT